MHRTPGLIRRDNTEVYRVALVVAGSPVLRQRDREARLQQGEFAIYDCAQPYVFAHSSSSQLALFNIPHQLRHLHRMFEGENTTVSAWIRQRRLERCRDDLADPVNAGIPVSSVAARWGMTNAAHFSRAFRRAYGIPPNEYRRMCLVPP